MYGKQDHRGRTVYNNLDQLREFDIILISVEEDLLKGTGSIKKICDASFLHDMRVK